jgi:hypothetical protein
MPSLNPLNSRYLDFQRHSGKHRPQGASRTIAVTNKATAASWLTAIAIGIAAALLRGWP